MTKALGFFIVGTLMMLWGLYDGFKVFLAINDANQETTSTSSALGTMIVPIIKFISGIALFMLAKDAVLTLKKEQDDSRKR